MTTSSLRRTSLGQYRLVDFVGAGGMGEVFRAVHTTTGRIVALKVLTAAGRGTQMVERFRNEARIHSTLSHPGVATMFEWFEEDGLPCIAMEFVDGETLEHRLRTRGPFLLEEGLSTFAAVVDAVGYVHQRGVVHRDIKSNNVKVTTSGAAKLLDFGIAKSGESPKLTTDGSVIGTLQYLSPEQLRTGQAEPRSDVWALGVLLYELLTGRMPFEGGALGVLTERLLKGIYQPATQLNPQLPREVDRIIGRCLKVNIADRYASAEALLTDVRALLPSQAPLPVRRRSDEFQQLASWFSGRGALGASMFAAAAAFAFLVYNLVPAGGGGGSGNGTTHLVPDTAAVAPAPPPDSAAFSARDRMAGELAGPEVREGLQWARPAGAASPRPDELRVGSGANMQTALIDAQGNLIADVLFEGRVVGRTPLLLRAPIGQYVLLTLRRRGFEDEQAHVTITELPQQYQYVLRPVTPRDSQ